MSELSQEKNMLKQWFRGACVLIFTSLVLAGCAGSEPQQPPEQLPAEDQTQVPVEVPEQAPEEPKDMDAYGNPVDMATGQPLARTFYFDFDKASLSPEDLAVLEMHAGFLRSHPDRSILIAGHCDERGTREYNLALGERRADAVRSFLVSSGVRRSQVETVSYGEERPADPGHNERAWSKNRRAEMQYR